jgi:hypothetical protein
MHHSNSKIDLDKVFPGKLFGKLLRIIIPYIYKRKAGWLENHLRMLGLLRPSHEKIFGVPSCLI